MASMTFTVASATVNGSKVFTLTDAEMARWIAAEKSTIGPAATNAQALLAWADRVMHDAKTRTLQFEQAAAAATVTPLNPT